MAVGVVTVTSRTLYLICEIFQSREPVRHSSVGNHTVMPMSAHFDVVVLGAGPGGYVAAIRAAQLGLKTAVIEKKYWGGVCLNVGCIPTKALLRNAEIAHIVTKEADTFGISGDISVDYGKAFSRSRGVADKMVKGVHFLMKKNKITEVDGWGQLRRCPYPPGRAERRGGGGDHHLRQLHHRRRVGDPHAAGHAGLGECAHLRGTDPGRHAAEVDHRRRFRGRSGSSSRTCCRRTGWTSPWSSTPTRSCRPRTTRSPRN